MPEDSTSDLNIAAPPAHWGMNFTKTIHAKRDSSIDPTHVRLPAGYTVVVTGAGKGIGEYIAKAYVEAQAQNIILTSRTASDLERVKAELEAIAAKQGRTVNVTVCANDATDIESYKAIAAILNTSYGGRLDCLVNNAGGGDTTLADRPPHEGDPNVFSKTTVLNYFAPYHAAMTLIPFLLDARSEGKTLINIVSGAAHLVDLPPFSYNVAKLATTRMTEILAAAYAKEGLRSFAVNPGMVPTPGALREVPNLIPLLTDDVHLCGDVCVWLSAKQPAWASGRYISATWDMTELEAMKEDVVKGDKLKFRMVV